MQKRFLALIFFTFSYICFSQDLVIQGRVQDEKSLPVAFANVVVFNNGAFVNGTTTNDNGYFQIENLNASNYILKVSFLGYESVELPISLKSDITVENIILKETIEALDGVTVIAKKPTVKRMVDRIVFNVENSTLSNNNVLDVLKQTPGVLVYDGNITVKNTTPVVYINDRKVHLSTEEVQQLLEGTPAGNIKSIEVITSPPARYEAEGGAILNIVTSKNIVAGYHGSLFGNFKQGFKYPKHSYGTSHFFKTKKLNTYINYNISPRKDFRNNFETINFFNNEDNQVESRWRTDYKRTRESSNHNINSNIDYELDKNNSLSFSSNILISPRENSRISTNSNTNIFGSDGVLDSLFITKNRLVDEAFNLAFAFGYKHKFKKEGEKLSFNLHYTNYDFSNFQDVFTNYFLNDENSPFRDNRFQTFSSQVIELYTGQIDYELPINEYSNFESGVKVSNINSENILNQFIFIDDIKEEDLDTSDIFLYKETNYAAYLSFSKDWETWSLKTGLRAEYTRTTGNSLTLSSINENNYLKFFPSFHIMHQLNPNDNIYLRYNKRINRPRYKSLNPFKYYFTDNSFSKGDPELRPQIDDVFTLGYTFSKDYTFELYFRNEKDYITEIVSQDNELNLIKYISTNTDAITYGLDFSTYTSIVKNWNLYALFSAFYYKNKVLTQETDNLLYDLDKWSFYGQLINYFSFLRDKSLTMDISYLYISPVIEGPTTISTRHGLDINLRKSFWNNKASLNIGISDIFNTKNESYLTKYLDQDISLNSILENRMLIIGFNYKFGNYKLKPNQKSIDLKERERLKSN